MRALFTAQPGSGHWRPLAPLARALATAGHEVAFASSPIFCAIIAEHGFRCFPAGSDEWLEESRQPQEGNSQQAEPEQAAWVWANVFAGTRAARSVPDLLAICHDWRPAVLVRELTEFGGCVAAERLGLPHAAVQVGAFRPHLHRLVAPPLNRLREAVGLPPDPDLAMLYRYLLLSSVPPSYQDPAHPLPPTTHAVRHVSFDLDRPDDNRLPSWAARLPARPTIYATLGTAYNRTPGVFPAILAALRDEPINLVLTLGPNQDPADLGHQPPHVHVERYIPQSVFLPHCDLVITHGGFGTVLTALDHGLPMVIIPIAADMPDNARRCADLGLAKVIAPDQRTSAAIQAATRTVLRDARYQRNAERLRDEMRELPGPHYAVQLLERLAVEKRPLAAAG